MVLRGYEFVTKIAEVSASHIKFLSADRVLDHTTSIPRQVRCLFKQRRALLVYRTHTVRASSLVSTPHASTIPAQLDDPRDSLACQF